jgi:hypothetical protein
MDLIRNKKKDLVHRYREAKSINQLAFYVANNIA